MFTQPNPEISEHARVRCAQRNLAEDEIDFIIEHGNRVRRTGVIFCQLRRCDLPDTIDPAHHYNRLVGSTVVLSNCGCYVLTAYRDERAFRRDSRKTKYRKDRHQGLYT